MHFVDFDELTNHIRRIATEVVGARRSKSTLSCTSYDPVAHAVKGIIQPSGVESGWVAIGALHTGNGYGILVGPSVGDANGVGGDQFDLDHEGGDPNTLVARYKQFSSVDKPPQVQPGEMLLQHANGNKVSFTKDGSLTLTHGKSGATMFFDANGNITHNGNGMNVNVMTNGKGSIAVAASGTGGLSLAGSTLSMTGTATLNGQPIKTGV